MLGLATSNYCNAMLGSLGIKVLFYYNFGPLVVSSLYFVLQKMGYFGLSTKRSTSRATGIYQTKELQRGFLRNDDGEFDFQMIGFVIIGALLINTMTIVLNRTWYLCKLANLNIGVAQSV